jgi:pre-mRNA-processing factor 40
MKEKAERRERHEEKKRKKVIDDFKDLLRRVRLDMNDTSWGAAKEKLETHKTYQRIADEETKRKLFEEYIAKLQKKGEDNHVEEKREKDSRKREWSREKESSDEDAQPKRKRSRKQNDDSP